MKIKSFEYAKATKSGVEISDRKVIVLHPAKDYDHTIDITDIELPMALEILSVELKNLDAEYTLRLKELLTEFGLENKLRNFKLNRMSNEETTEI